MAKFIKAWRGACAGEIHPTKYEPGDECPEELESAAHAAKALEGDVDGVKAPVKATAKAPAK